MPLLTGEFDDVPTLTPTVGSIAGGTMLTVEGHGFTLDTDDPSRSTTATVGGQECRVIESTHSRLSCETPPLVEGIYDVDVTVAGVVHDAIGMFSYEGSITPTVDDMTPVSGGVGATVTFTGTRFSTIQSMMTVSFVAADDDVTGCTVIDRYT